MDYSEPNRPGLDAYTMVLLRHNDRYLMLQRSEQKHFAPGRWTGIGGRVERAELGDLTLSALREIREETGITPDRIQDLTLRRTLLQQRAGHPIVVLLYFTGIATLPDVEPTAEGTLHWLTQDEIVEADVIENTAVIIPLLIDDMRRDPEGHVGTITGAAANDSDGAPARIVWSQ